jgi:signal transduction histidine kinase
MKAPSSPSRARKVANPFPPSAQVVTKIQDKLKKEIEAEREVSEGLRARLSVMESLQSLSDTISTTSDLKSALGDLNRGICAAAGINCSRVAFDEEALATLLGVPHCTEAEKELIVGWRRQKSAEPIFRRKELVTPVMMQSRIAGVMWVQLKRKTAASLSPSDVEISRAIAAGAGEVAYKAKLRRTAERRGQDLAAAGERERIARDLHDTIGQTLYGINLRLLEMLPRIEDPNLASEIAELRAVAGQGLSDIRNTVYALSFLNIRTRGFVPSMKALAKEFERATGVLAEIKVESELRLADDVEGALFRVVHEALVNVDRHARASAVIVSIASGDESVELKIRDDGVGLDQRQSDDWQSAAHFGVLSMARAIEEVGGRFQMQNAYPRGLLIKATAPLRRRAGPRLALSH